MAPTETQAAIDPGMTGLGSIDAAIAALRRGDPVVVLDDPDRENEADLVLAAETVSAASIAFMVRHTSGVICVSAPGGRLDALDLPLMVPVNTEAMGTAFTVSVDYRPGTTSGISAADRAATIRALIDDRARPEDFARPGHVFPLRCRPGGVLERAGHTEAAADLASLAGLFPAAVLCELVTADGTMARGEEASGFAATQGLITITIDQIIAHRWAHEQLVTRQSSTVLATPYGPFTAHTFTSRLDQMEHMALVCGDVSGLQPPVVSIHSECLSADVFGSSSCDCRKELEMALGNVGRQGGVVVYLRGHRLQTDSGHGGLVRDRRHRRLAAQILADLGASSGERPESALAIAG